jgi:cell wall-associated NlpC family hydrolase
MPGNTLNRRRRLAPLLPAALIALAFGTTVAAPLEPAPDPVGQLLAERGLIDAPADTPADSVRTDALSSQALDKASDMVLAALNFLDVPYRRGGNDDAGFDCSGFTRHVFGLSLGLVLPRRVDEQAAAAGLHAVRRNELRPGDLVFFNTLRRTFSHVGIYIGENRFIHAPRTGAQVRVEDMRVAYWRKRYTGARRAETLRGAAHRAAPASVSMPPASGNPAEAARMLY